ncbi:glycine zipper domain-containing protein [Rhodospirillales bacterium]|nr:glycine zipper domain-containing protein [Rhodospirillales bacterium]
MKIRVLFLVVVLLTAAGCQTTGGGASSSNQADCENTGMLVGAILGGLIGSQVGKGRGRVVGALVGAAAAGIFGKMAGGMFCKMNRQERVVYSEARNEVLREVPVNETVAWANPDSDVAAQFTPKREYENTEGQTCRLLDENVTVRSDSGQSETLYCLDPETNDWEPVT